MVKIDPTADYETNWVQIEAGWYACKTHKECAQFIAELPDEALPYIAEQAFWPYIEVNTLVEAVCSRGNLNIVQAMGFYADSAAAHLGRLEVEGKYYMESEDTIAGVRTLQKNLNARVFSEDVSLTDPDLHVPEALTHFMRNYDAEMMGSYALDAAVIAAVKPIVAQKELASSNVQCMMSNDAVGIPRTARVLADAVDTPPPFISSSYSYRAAQRLRQLLPKTA